ncbi:MAG: response regulator transcription factor [Bacteroidales bacterium]|nr:response regulator transcription factor [Bacteroidales bacterium]
MAPIYIMLVDDHQIVRDGIKSLLNGYKGIEVIAEASGENELYRNLKKRIPSILLLDISMPGKSGIEIAKELHYEYPCIGIIFLSMYINEEFILNALKSGAKAYLPKDTTKAELIRAIEAVHHGKEFFPPQISEIILQSYMNRVKREEQDDNQEKKELTRRETEILTNFAEGLTNQEIADKLFISIRTVECHKTNIMHKLGFKTTVDLVRYAIKHKLVNI